MKRLIMSVLCLFLLAGCQPPVSNESSLGVMYMQTKQKQYNRYLANNDSKYAIRPQVCDEILQREDIKSEKVFTLFTQSQYNQTDYVEWSYSFDGNEVQSLIDYYNENKSSRPCYVLPYYDNDTMDARVVTKAKSEDASLIGYANYDFAQLMGIDLSSKNLDQAIVLKCRVAIPTQKSAFLEDMMKNDVEFMELEIQIKGFMKENTGSLEVYIDHQALNQIISKNIPIEELPTDTIALFFNDYNIINNMKKEYPDYSIEERWSLYD